MNKKNCLKKSKMFLKMARLDFAVIRIMKIAKLLLTAALFVNSAAFFGLLILGMRKIKE